MCVEVSDILSLVYSEDQSLYYQPYVNYVSRALISDVTLLTFTLVRETTLDHKSEGVDEKAH